jgi:hypothetical protein
MAAPHTFVEAPPQAPVTTTAKPNIMQNAVKLAEAVKANEAPPAPTKPSTETPKAPEVKVEAPAMTYAELQKRASEAKPSESTKPEAPKAPEEIQTQAELDKITDPTQRAIIEKKIKDLESGYNKKYQSLAEQRKEVEDLKFKLSNWTPQRLLEEARKPEFAQALQALQQQAPPSNFEGNTEEWSALSEPEKSRMREMEREQQSLKAQLQQMRQKDEDLEIKKTFPDFEPQVVDEAIEGLRTGAITASRLDIFKVVNYDKHVEQSATNGYKYGWEDGYKKALEKLNGNTHLNGNLSVTPSDEVPDDVKKGGFSSIANWRLNQLRMRSQKK